MDPLWTAEEFEERARAVLDERYHHRHPFNMRMHDGVLSREELQDWVLNRYYYQRRVVEKDAVILARLPSREHRRVWLSRIIDQDGRDGDQGGLQDWVDLAEALGLSREELADDSRLAPGARFAVDAYVHFCAVRTWQEAVAASLTQLYVPEIMRTRVEALQRHYGVGTSGLRYHERHREVAERESVEALALLHRGLRTREDQERAIAAVRFKCDVLWSLLDAVDAVR
jgi:pyrroloquinoline-quinone synthase